MAKVCDKCGKGYQKGHLVSFSNKKAIKRSHPNLRTVRVVINGRPVKFNMCASCLKRSKMVVKAPVVNAEPVVATV